ncbi:MAG: hypothetical protein PHC61_13945 [Chitinivibrionales bacterium]|nr:hypothetical protein [Chitinivibrionales bacterium]
MEKIDFALLSDGPSDKTLVPIIKWVLRRQFGMIPINGEWADLRGRIRTRRVLAKRIALALDYYPCDILFIHRDAEAQEPIQRYNEIAEAIQECKQTRLITIPHICVVPIRMTEAWLLFDENAIRKASGNPNGQSNLNLPVFGNIEEMPDPKNKLFEILLAASELRGRHLRRFSPEKRRHLIADYITDFQPLLQLSGFQCLIGEVARLTNHTNHR